MPFAGVDADADSVSKMTIGSSSVRLVYTTALATYKFYRTRDSWIALRCFVPRCLWEATADALATVYEAQAPDRAS